MKKPRKRTTLKEDMGKFLLDFGKLVFAGIVFGSIMRSEIPQDALLTIGVALATVSCIGGLILGKREISSPTQTKLAKKPAIKRSFSPFTFSPLFAIL